MRIAHIKCNTYAKWREVVPRFMRRETGAIVSFRGRYSSATVLSSTRKRDFLRYFLLFFALTRCVVPRSLARTKHREIYPENTSCARHHAIKRQHYGAKENSRERRKKARRGLPEYDKKRKKVNVTL